MSIAFAVAISSAAFAREHPAATSARGHRLIGSASWYGNYEQGRPTANGERFDRHGLTCAHKTLPFGTVVRIIDTETGATATCRINDRGPYKPGRIIDCAEKISEMLGFRHAGLARHVRVEVLRWGKDDTVVEVAEAPPPRSTHAHAAPHGRRRRG